LLKTPELTDGVVVLRLMTIADAEAHLANEDDVTVRFFGGRSTIETSRAAIEEARLSWKSGGTWLNLGIWEAATGELVGYVDANLACPGYRPGVAANITYNVRPAVRGRGYVPRAVGLMLRHLSEQTSAKAAVIQFNPENHASARVAQKSGFRNLGERLHEDGTSMVVYGLPLRPLPNELSLPDVLLQDNNQTDPQKDDVMSLSVQNNLVPSLPYPELPGVIDRLVAGIKEELGGNLVGIYLVGSLATGDFDLDSDIDFMVVTKDELTEVTVQSLQAIHVRINGLGCYPAQHLEGSYISLDQLNQSEGVGIQPLWYLDNGSTTFERSNHDNQWHVRWILRERGITILGPGPGSLLPPIPVERLLAEVKATMLLIADLFVAELGQPIGFWNSRFGQSFAVLTYCRMLNTLATGTVRSKLAGVKWARQTLDPEWAGFIQQAWEEREGVRHCVKRWQLADAGILGKTLEFIRYAVLKTEKSNV